jgi:hypothetical protein
MKVILPEIKRYIKRNTSRRNLKEIKKQDADIDTLILFTLHKEFGFGKTRLLRFAKSIVKIHDYYMDRYDDADIFAMQQELLGLGVDVARLEEYVKN